MQDIIKKVLEIAVHAPSGENCQPWKFIVKENAINIFNIPERDDSLYNKGQRASFIAHGALIENIVIAAQTLGFRALVNTFPEQSNPNMTAKIRLEPTTPANDPLYPFIDKRVTNRKPYQTIALTAQQREALLAGDAFGSVKTFIAEDKDAIKKLADAAAANEEILFGNRCMHNFFFSHINWTEEEKKEKRMGFYTKELELNPQQLGAFKLFRHWPAMKLLSMVGVSKFIAKENAKVYASSSVMMAIVIDGDNPSDFLNIGRTLQRMWLKTTQMRLSLQPLTGILFLMLGIKTGNIKNELSPAHVRLVKEKYEIIQNTFNIAGDKTIAMMFRIGKADAPSAKSLRLPVDIKS